MRLIIIIILINIGGCNIFTENKSKHQQHVESKKEINQSPQTLKSKVVANHKVHYSLNFDNQPNSVIELSLREKGYKKFPEKIFMCKNLKHLDLSFNSIEEIPAKIKELTKLETLSINRNKIKDLPKEIGSLNNLKSIDFLANNISEIPTSLCNLKKIERINLADNIVTNIPKCLGNSKTLKLLALTSTKVEFSKEDSIFLKKSLPNTLIFVNE